MKTPPPSNATLRSRFAQRLEVTFGCTDWRMYGRMSLAGLGLVALLVAGSASAEWAVNDREARATLEKILAAIGEDPDDVNTNLDKLHKQQKVSGEKYDPGQDEETKSKLAEAPDFENKATNKARRCGGEKLPEAQKPVCEAIVQLEEDRYTYLQEMRKLSEKREEELRKIYQERNGIGEDEPGKLQSNTNRLLALLTHQRIDELNLIMAMETFDDRIRERREHLNYLGSVAMNPRNKTEGAGTGGGFDWGGLFDGAAQVAALEAALQLARERDR